MSSSIFRVCREEHRDSDNDDDGNHNSNQQPLELHEENEEFIENTDKDDGVDEKDEEIFDIITVTADTDFLDKQQQQLGADGLSSTEDDDDNDGFRTPTSLEHKIPVPTQCPPAPKKNLKRKFEVSAITEIIRSIASATLG